jgi:uncharacterized protein YukE
MPDIAGSRIAVPADLGESGPQILAIGVSIDEELMMLRKLLAPLAEEWTGGAAGGHQDVQTQWDTASQNLMTDVGYLGDIARTQQHNWVNYVDCEGANTASWQH